MNNDESKAMRRLSNALNKLLLFIEISILLIPTLVGINIFVSLVVSLLKNVLSVPVILKLLSSI